MKIKTVLAAAAAILAAAAASAAGSVAPRAEKKPYIAFKDAGRYLPPGGLRAVALASMNVPKIDVGIGRVPSANVVQMLALEEEAYSRIWSSSWRGRDSFVEDLAGKAERREIVTENAPDRRETFPVEVSVRDGGATNGVFLVTAEGAGAEESRIFRVVCISDLGLSVRSCRSGLYVWVVSLSDGRPVSGARIDVFSSANVLLASGRTDAGGLCFCRRGAEGEPFAVVATAADGGDSTFLALGERACVDEAPDESSRPEYLADEECEAFVWTERGIYRHGERIFVHALLRNGRGETPRPFPVELALFPPRGAAKASKTALSDEFGAVCDDTFSVPPEQPSGVWRVVAKIPGEKGRILGAAKIRIEEFAPPQIRVGIDADGESADPRDFGFGVTAEHLFGGPAKRLPCEGAVVFEDAPFAPKGFEGWHFGDAAAGLKPSFRRLAPSSLDDNGACRFHAPLFADSGRPRACVLATAQGTVFEDGGRPATARATRLLHYYERYIGADVGTWMRAPEAGPAAVGVVCVGSDGAPARETKRLLAKLERIECVYSYRRRNDGWAAWDSARVRSVVADGIPVEVPAGGEGSLDLPQIPCGEYALTICGGDGDAPFSTEFYLSDRGDGEVRAPLSNPTAVTIAADRDEYRPGDIPRLVIRSPFPGRALLGVFRDDAVYVETLTLTNATSEIELRPVDVSWAPNVDVRLSVVRGAYSGSKGLAVRAHGEATLRVRRAADVLPVSLETAVDVAGGNVVDVDVTAAGVSATGAVAVVTLVDEGINLLTGGDGPDPAGYFSRPRRAGHPLHDIYRRILPVIGEDSPRAAGIMTGGGEGAEMLGRVSPVPSRRFRPLAMWSGCVRLESGRGHARFTLPEFAGQVRVSAVAYGARAVGAATSLARVAPRLVARPDAPRFVAPGDRFGISLPLSNRSGEDGTASYEIRTPDGNLILGTAQIKNGDTEVLRFAAEAPREPGEAAVSFKASGFGESHEIELAVPVRPAVAWRERVGVIELAPGETFDEPQTPLFRYTVSDSPVARLRGALEWLADYPHGCLEQTSSRVLPLVAAGDVLAAHGSVAAEDVGKYVEAGVRRVESMARERDFVMWPDCGYAPWDVEVSLYAAHFLFEAERSGVALEPSARGRVLGFLSRWAVSPTNSVAAYACHTLALAGRADRDRMLSLYDARGGLDLLSRARLARAFAAGGDGGRAAKLLANVESPASVKEASFALLALLETEPEDARIPALVAYIDSRRGGGRYSWGTTAENAHALLALGAYWRAKRPDTASRFVCWRRLELPDPASVTNESSSLTVSRRYLTAEGAAADLSDLRCGDLLVAEIRVGSDVERDYSDLVVEDLFPGAFEPVHSAIDTQAFPWAEPCGTDWVMRRDARDDRMLVFSKRFHLKAGEAVWMRYPVRVVSSGDYTLPGVSVEAMYQPGVHARTAPSRCRVAGDDSGINPSMREKSHGTSSSVGNGAGPE